MTATSVHAPAYTPTYTPAIAEPAPSGIRRFAERFALIAFGLYHLPLFVNNYPSLGGGGFNDDGLAPRWGHVFTPPGVWVARHVFHIAGEMRGAYNGDNGDVAEEYARLLLAVVIGLVAAAVWTSVDRRRPGGLWVSSTLRVLLRYSIVLGLMSYGIAKIFPQQFPPIAPQVLETRVGDLPPMGLLWTFMEYSRPYAFFGGLMELVAIAFLCFRRTATLGALLCLAVMTNVALLNYAYGVPVKLYATMVTVSAAVLVLYDARRLFEFFVLNRAIAVSQSQTWLQDHVPSVWRRTLKVMGVGSVALSSIVAMAPTMNHAEQTGVQGMWRVSDAATSWRRLSISPAAIMIRTVGDSTIRCGGASVADAGEVALACGQGRHAQLRLTAAHDTLHADGTFEKAPVHVTANRVTRSSYNLMRGRFRWMVQ